MQSAVNEEEEEGEEEEDSGWVEADRPVPLLSLFFSLFLL
jgi:hypothetical protein